jgi:hypothetical protein
MATQKKTPSRRLLVLACSSRKSQSTGLLPAIERYDGVAYRVVKRLQRLGVYPDDVDLLIVSAKYGIISSEKAIQNYNLRMTPKLALEQVEDNRAVLEELVQTHDYKEIFIAAGRVYLLALEPSELWQGSAPIRVNKGRIGEQLRSLKEWLLQ